ncbi:hypothetical protein B0H13DRAFT_1855478 [Mycena leptocephala]|nr:hypothetical protein B0H13DRAFT_1855478 [Mycena leptocephala]
MFDMLDQMLRQPWPHPVASVSELEDVSSPVLHAAFLATILDPQGSLFSLPTVKPALAPHRFPSPSPARRFTPTSTSEYIARSTKGMVDASTVDCNAKEDDDEPGGEMCTDTTRRARISALDPHPTRQRSALPTIPSSSPLRLPFFFSPHFCSASPHDPPPPQIWRNCVREAASSGDHNCFETYSANRHLFATALEKF